MCLVTHHAEHLLERPQHVEARPEMGVPELVEELDDDPDVAADAPPRHDHEAGEAPDELDTMVLEVLRAVLD